jgi:release factor glutamine methyltransferase
MIDPSAITIQDLIPPAVDKLKTAGSPTPLLEAQLWLVHVCDLSRAQLLARPEHRLTPAQVDQFQAGLARLVAGEPLPYLLGYAEFYGLRFRVTPHTLIPRPETEHLVEAALKLASRYPQPRIADIGTGSGCIAVTLAVELPAAHLVAVDASPAALAVAQQNAAAHGVEDRITFQEGSLLEPLAGRVQLIAANLPYVADHEWDQLPSSVRDYEPAGALRGGPAGLNLIEGLLRQVPAKLSPGGGLLLEIGAAQGPVAQDLAHRYLPAAWVQLQQDYGGRDRLLIIQT